MKAPSGSRAVATSLIIGLSLLGAPSATPAQESDRHVIRVCTHPAAGFFARDSAGVPKGLEYDLLTGFGVAAHVGIQFVDSPSFDELLKDTESGKCQIGASTITVTPERKLRFLFSSPYFPNRVVVVQKNASGATQPSDLSGRRVAVVKGTLSTRLVGDIAGVNTLIVSNDDAAFDALLKGEADALACDSAVVLHYLSLHPELAIAFPIGERSFFAFALPKTSKLAGPLNVHLQNVSRNGELKKLLARHFGEENATFLAAEITPATKP